MKDLVRKLLRVLPDEWYIEVQYFYHFHRFANLTCPQTFNEKLQWLKLHDHNPLYTTLVDKYAVKQWVADKIGSQYVIPTLGMWNSAQDINFDQLPKQFVLKVNHDSGGLVICRDKDKLDQSAAVAKLAHALKNNGYWYGREWPYKRVACKILAEQFLREGENQDLTDYKFFCFNGNPTYCQVITDRSTHECIDFFDMAWNLQPFTGLHLPGHVFAHASPVPRKPVRLEQMKQMARQLAKNMPFVRVDFYEVNGQVYFGEMTFFPAGGLGEFTPSVWNKKLGDLISLSARK